MRVIGLTGGIASGKSTVSRMLKKLGAHIFDADIIAREIVAPGSSALREIVRAFGRDVLLPGGELDRSKLGRLVFGDREKLAVLNGITHPRVKAEIARRLKMLKSRSDTSNLVAVIDAPLLIEAGLTGMAEEVWLVAVDEETQLKRLMDRDGLSRDEALLRLASQMPLKNKLGYADRVINNNGTEEETRRQVMELWRQLTAGSGS